jgi:hypothetical protein
MSQSPILQCRQLTKTCLTAEGQGFKPSDQRQPRLGDLNKLELKPAHVLALGFAGSRVPCGQTGF